MLNYHIIWNLKNENSGLFVRMGKQKMVSSFMSLTVLEFTHFVNGCLLHILFLLLPLPFLIFPLVSQVVIIRADGVLSLSGVEQKGRMSSRWIRLWTFTKWGDRDGLYITDHCLPRLTMSSRVGVGWEKAWISQMKTWHQSVKSLTVIEYIVIMSYIYIWST